MMAAPRFHGPSRQQSDYEYFSLHTSRLMLLSEGQQLVVDHVLETVTLVDWKEQPPRFLRSCSFFAEDLCLLCPLLGAWPAMVPYTHLITLLGNHELVSTHLLCCQSRLALFGLTILPVDDGLVINSMVEGEREAGPCSK